MVAIPQWLRAAAEREKRRRRDEYEALPSNDPITRLFDPAFTDTFWDYEWSRLDGPIPGKLHPKQLIFLEDNHTHRWLFWGNQAGKTSVGALDLVLKALGRHPLQLAGLTCMPPRVAWASALTWELWENILLPELLTWIPHSRILKAPEPGQKGGSRVIKIRADNGKVSRIVGKSAEQGAGSYQSAKVHDIWFDEEHPEAVYRECQPRLMRFGGRTHSSMTPLKGLSWPYALVYEPLQGDPQGEEYKRTAFYHSYSHAGVADNPAITAEALAAMEFEFQHVPNELESRKHGRFTQPAGAVYNITLDTNGITLENEPGRPALKTFLAGANMYGAIDFGKWRFGFAFGGVDRDGDLVLVDEFLSQNEDSRVRAKRIHDMLHGYGVRSCLIYGDCAAPDDLLLLNQHLQEIDSPYYVVACDFEAKDRKGGVARLQSLINSRRIKLRRTMGSGQTWYLGKSSQSVGHARQRSRLLWELQNLQYPKMPDGKVQSDDPDDDTADGADMHDLLRYLVMQWLGPLQAPAPIPKARTTQQIIAEEFAKLDEEEQGQTTTDPDIYGPVLRGQ